MTQPGRFVSRRRFVIASLAILAMALASCGSASSSPGPSKGAEGSTTTALAASPATTASLAIAAPAGATLPQTIHVLEDPRDWAEVKVGSLSGCKDAYCLGDYIVGSSTMLDAVTRAGVGTLATECFIVNAGTGRYHCPATTIVLTGRGTIVFTEDPYLGLKFCPGCFPQEPPNTVDYPVIGGSGEFVGVTGEVTSPADSTWQYGDFVITLTK